MNKRLAFVFFVLIVGSAMAFAQQLPVSPSAVKLDGVVADKEYALTLPLGKMAVSLTRTADTVNMAISAPTNGWVALGFGSEKMDGARLFLGTVERGNAAVSQQRGSGHGHRDLSDPLKLDYAMSEADGSTTLEMAFKAPDVIPAGQTAVTFLAAYGADDTISAYHVARGRVTVTLK